MFYLLILWRFKAPRMGNPYFEFKQFTVWHERCAMKVGTDGVLLGAWSYVFGCKHILDIGSGSGVVSLMVAQRVPEACVYGVEIDAHAAVQAQENVARSPFSNRVRIASGDVCSLSGEFDAIVCNPPFFTEDTCPADMGRALARNSSSLTYDALWRAVARLLLPEGYFSVVLPYKEYVPFYYLALERGFDVCRTCTVKTVERKAPKRILATFSRVLWEKKEESILVLQGADGKRSPDYEALTRDFYLTAT